jgi:hypothetical protein
MYNKVLYPLKTSPTRLNPCYKLIIYYFNLDYPYPVKEKGRRNYPAFQRCMNIIGLISSIYRMTEVE